jgi:nitrilase
MQSYTIAAVQAAPVFLNREATMDKAEQLIAEASREGARLVVFPETFVPAYPDWVWAIPPGRGSLLGELYSELVDQSVTVPGPATERLGEAARAAGSYVAIGVNERNTAASDGSLYNTLLYFDPQGNFIGKHQKLVPTAPERMVWAPGSGSTLEVYDTSIGKLSGLICWENYMPLARYAMWAWGAQIHIAPTWDRGEPWISTLRHTAKEGRVYVLGCGSALRRDDIPDSYAFKQNLSTETDWVNPGDSVIIDPDGKFIAGPVRNEETILYAEMEPRNLRGPRYQLDVAGHYSRPDIFQLTVDRSERPSIRTLDATEERQEATDED